MYEDVFFPRGNGDDLHNYQFIYELTEFETSRTANRSKIWSFFFQNLILLLKHEVSW